MFSANGLYDADTRGVFVSGSTIYAATVGGLYISIDPPTVTSISPINGPTDGGTSITITGTNLTGATGITVGGVACSAFSVISSTSATCTTPVGTVGTASVLVTTPGGTNPTNALFTYAAAVAAAIPTLSEWALIFLASLMAMLGFMRLRRH
jgi:hypothetical protein